MITIFGGAKERNSASDSSRVIAVTSSPEAFLKEGKKFASSERYKIPE
jgi:hypothetical protein